MAEQNDVNRMLWREFNLRIAINKLNEEDIQEQLKGLEGMDRKVKDNILRGNITETPSTFYFPAKTGSKTMPIKLIGKEMYNSVDGKFFYEPKTIKDEDGQVVHCFEDYEGKELTGAVSKSKKEEPKPVYNVELKKRKIAEGISAYS
jgi:hypothetical protein